MFFTYLRPDKENLTEAPKFVLKNSLYVYNDSIYQYSTCRTLLEHVYYVVDCVYFRLDRFFCFLLKRCHVVGLNTLRKPTIYWKLTMRIELKISRDVNWEHSKAPFNFCLRIIGKFFDELLIVVLYLDWNWFCYRFL